MPTARSESIAAAAAVDQLLSLVVEAHGRDTKAEPFVGGLFNGYEKAIHYELITGLYRLNLWGVRTEERVPGPLPRQCDIVLPVREGGETCNLWLEVKSWWFLLGPQRYCSSTKTLWWPGTDWEKLQPAIDAKSGDHRAVMLARFWNECSNGRNRTGKKIADERLSKVDGYMRNTLGTPAAAVRDLRSFTYTSYDPPITTFGDVRIWLTTNPTK